MRTVVIDASIAIKWVVEERGTAEAWKLRQSARLIAPDLLVAECANILWKKVEKKEVARDEARLAARLLQAAGLELFPTLAVLEVATDMAIALNHPAYDCVYLALAAENDCPFVTADERLLRKLAQRDRYSIPAKAISLSEAVAGA